MATAFRCRSSKGIIVVACNAKSWLVAVIKSKGQQAHHKLKDHSRCLRKIQGRVEQDQERVKPMRKLEERQINLGRNTCAESMIVVDLVVRPTKTPSTVVSFSHLRLLTLFGFFTTLSKHLQCINRLINEFCS